MDSYQEIIFKLKKYWSDRDCIIQEPYDLEVGAGTMCPETFLRVLGPKPYRVAYVQPSRRPAGLHIRYAIWFWPQNAQEGFRAHGAGAHFEIVGLLNDTVAIRPVLFELEDDFLV